MLLSPSNNVKIHDFCNFGSQCEFPSHMYIMYTCVTTLIVEISKIILKSIVKSPLILCSMKPATMVILQW